MTKEEIIKKYDSRIKDLGEYGANNILYSYGEKEGLPLLEKAINENAYIEIVYDLKADDGISELKFIPTVS